MKSLTENHQEQETIYTEPLHAAQRTLAVYTAQFFDRAVTLQLLPKCRWEKFAALANPISAGQMTGAASAVPDNFD